MNSKRYYHSCTKIKYITINYKRISDLKPFNVDNIIITNDENLLNSNDFVYELNENIKQLQNIGLNRIKEIWKIKNNIGIGEVEVDGNINGIDIEGDGYNYVELKEQEIELKVDDINKYHNNNDTVGGTKGWI